MKTETRLKTSKSPVQNGANHDQLHALLYEALETEKGGVLVYETAVRCAINDDLKAEWDEYLSQTKNHVTVLIDVLKKLGLNPDQDTPGRNVVRHSGVSLVKTMEVAMIAGKPEAAQIVAAECVTLAETKDHANWSLLSKLAESATGKEKEALEAAVEEVEPEEDEHLYHTAGWARELALKALGLPAQLPPPEEEEDVKSQAEAAEAKEHRKPQKASK